MSDLRLPPRCQRDLSASGISRSVQCYFQADLSGQTIGPICKGQNSDCLIPEDGPDICPETSVRTAVSTDLHIYTGFIPTQLMTNTSGCCYSL